MRCQRGNADGHPFVQRHGSQDRLKFGFIGSLKKSPGAPHPRLGRGFPQSEQMPLLRQLNGAALFRCLGGLDFGLGSAVGNIGHQIGKKFHSPIMPVADTDCGAKQWSAMAGPRWLSRTLPGKGNSLTF